MEEVWTGGTEDRDLRFGGGGSQRIHSNVDDMLSDRGIPARQVKKLQKDRFENKGLRLEFKNLDIGDDDDDD